MRRVHERVVVGGPVAGGDRFDLPTDRDHRVDEAIELGPVLGLGRLDHQRARRPGTTSWARGSRSRSGAWRHRRRSRRVSRVIGRRSTMHSCATRPCAPGVEHGVVRREPAGDVVGVEDRDLRRLAQPFGAHHRDVRPGDRQDPGRPPRRRADRDAACPGRLRARAGGSAGTARGGRAHRSDRPPGPPPPCGMQNVLCKLMCDTSAPNLPGRARPTSALRFAPSRYT